MSCTGPNRMVPQRGLMVRPVFCPRGERFVPLLTIGTVELVACMVDDGTCRRVEVGGWMDGWKGEHDGQIAHSTLNNTISTRRYLRDVSFHANDLKFKNMSICTPHLSFLQSS